MNELTQQNPNQHHVVIVGGGFGGLYTAKALRNKPVKVTLIDKRNFHLFQALLYQVATGGLSPADIAYPLRSIFKDARNITTLKAEVVDIDPEKKEVLLRDGRVSFDTLIVAGGASYHYFGNDEWANNAPSLKTVEDALEIRRRILLAFEAAEREPDPQKRQAWLTFVVVGGGPTGVELAGALGELANKTLKGEFRHIDPTSTQIIVLEAADRVLTPYPTKLSAAAEKSLHELGVQVRKSTLLTKIDDAGVHTRHAEQESETFIPARTVLWAAGINASPLGEMLASGTGAELDRIGRVKVQPDQSLSGHPNIFVIGDMAHAMDAAGAPLPGVAQVAMQQGAYVARLLLARLQGQDLPPFVYKDKGNLAVIGRNAAVADLGSVQLSGFPAWFIWVFIHISYLIAFDNKLLVMIQWAWNYFTRRRGARLITGADPFPLVETLEEGEIQHLFNDKTISHSVPSSQEIQ